jgi:hypothetical protein
VPIRDDERFEHYLKQFRPIPPDSLQGKRHGRGTRRSFMFVAWAALAAAVLLAAALMMNSRRQPTHPPGGTESAAGPEQPAKSQPLTIGSTNDLLAHAPSFEAAVNQVAFQSQATPSSKGMHSALAVLSEENITL